MSALTEELDKILNAAEEADAPEEETDGRFHIDDPDKAGWALRKIRAANAEYDEFASECQARIDRLMSAANDIRARMNKAEDEKNRRVENFQLMLREWFDGLDAAKKKATKTQVKVRLPEGDLILKTPAPTVMHDDDVLIDWARGNGYDDLVNVKISPRWADIKARIEFSETGDPVDTVTGEIVPGVSRIINAPVFEVKI